MQENTYPTFNYYGEKLILLPGSKFTKKELQGRLNMMNIDYDINLNKKCLSSLYESNLKNDENKLAIFEKLIKDTQNYFNKFDYSERQSLPETLSSSNRHINNGKAMNISFEDVEPLNIKEQSFNKIDNNNFNHNKYSHNPFISNNYNKNKDKNISNSLINNNFIYNSRQNKVCYENNNIKNLDLNYGKNSSNPKNVLFNSHLKNKYQEEINTDINKNNVNSININFSNFNNDDHRQSIYSNINSNVTEYDKKSDLSFFSDFEPFLGTSLSKKRKKLCNDLIYLLILTSIGLGLFYLIINNSSEISDFLREFIKLLCSPLELIGFIKNLFFKIFFGALKYLYSIILLVIFFVFVLFYYKRLKIKKECKKILNEIINDMKNLKRDRSVRVSEIEIYKMYFENNGVSYDNFLTKYLPILNKLRKNRNQIKLSNEIQNGKNVVYWELEN